MAAAGVPHTLDFGPAQIEAGVRPNTPPADGLGNPGDSGRQRSACYCHRRASRRPQTQLCPRAQLTNQRVLTPVAPESASRCGAPGPGPPRPGEAVRRPAAAQSYCPRFLSDHPPVGLCTSTRWGPYGGPPTTARLTNSRRRDIGAIVTCRGRGTRPRSRSRRAGRCRAWGVSRPRVDHGATRRWLNGRIVAPTSAGPPVRCHAALRPAPTSSWCSCHTTAGQRLILPGGEPGYPAAAAQRLSRASVAALGMMGRCRYPFSRGRRPSGRR